MSHGDKFPGGERFPIRNYAAFSAALVVIEAAEAGLDPGNPVHRALSAAIRDVRDSLRDALKGQRIRAGLGAGEGAGHAGLDAAVSLSFLLSLYPLAAANVEIYATEDPSRESALRMAMEHAAGMLAWSSSSPATTARPSRSPGPTEAPLPHARR
jgi:hypothetical protein